MAKSNRYYLGYSVSLGRAISDCRSSIRRLYYWSMVEWKFRLRKAIKIGEFVLSFKHSPFSDFVYDDELLIESIANHYGYDMVDETLLSRKSIYKFALKSPS